MSARRVLAGIRRGGQSTTMIDPTASLTAVRPHPERPLTMTTPNMTAGYGFSAHSTGDDGTHTTMVSVQAPAKVAAAAAREFADLIDPWTPPVGGLDMRTLTWTEWLSKLLPFLRRR